MYNFGMFCAHYFTSLELTSATRKKGTTPHTKFSGRFFISTEKNKEDEEVEEVMLGSVEKLSCFTHFTLLASGSGWMGWQAGQGMISIAMRMFSTKGNELSETKLWISMKTLYRASRGAEGDLSKIFP